METEKKKALGIVALVLGGYALICVLGNGYSYYREFVACEVNPVTGRTKAEDQVWVTEMTKERFEREERTKKALDAVTFELITALYHGPAGKDKDKVGEILFQTQLYPDGERVFNCPGSATIYAKGVVIGAISAKSKWDGYTGDKKLWDKLIDDWEAGKPI